MGVLSIIGAFCAVWLAWTHGNDEKANTDHMLDRTFT